MFRLDNGTGHYLREALAKLNGRKLPVAVQDLPRLMRLPFEKLCSGGNGVGDATGEMRLADPTRGIEHGQALLGDDRVQDHLSLGYLSFQKLIDIEGAQARIHLFTDPCGIGDLERANSRMMGGIPALMR